MAQPSALAPPPTGSSQLRVSAQGNPTATWEPGGACPPKALCKSTSRAGFSLPVCISTVFAFCPTTYNVDSIVLSVSLFPYPP